MRLDRVIEVRHNSTHRLEPTIDQDSTDDSLIGGFDQLIDHLLWKGMEKVCAISI
jgi:hypothetical protein